MLVWHAVKMLIEARVDYPDPAHVVVTTWLNASLVSKVLLGSYSLYTELLAADGNEQVENTFHFLDPPSHFHHLFPSKFLLRT